MLSVAFTHAAKITFSEVDCSGHQFRIFLRKLNGNDLAHLVKRVRTSIPIYARKHACLTRYEVPETIYDVFVSSYFAR